MTKKIIRIGTRGSKLALYQANKVKEVLERKDSRYLYEIIIIKTKGDKILDVPLAKIGDKGLFTKELEFALFDGQIDMAVHSLKDLPTLFPKGAKLGGLIERDDNRDALVSITKKNLNDLQSGDVIATSSLRRKAQLLAMKKGFEIIDIRGNVNTRIRKMEEGYCDAMIMAAAGIQRLGMDQYIAEIIDPETLIPACGQGAIAIEIRDNDSFIEEIVDKINHKETHITATAERSFLNSLEGGCQIPIGSYAIIKGNQLILTGYLSDINGHSPIIRQFSGSKANPEQAGKDLAAIMINEGGQQIIDELRQLNDLTIKGEILKGKKIISTKPLRDNDLLQEKVENQEGIYISAPTIEILPINPDKESLKIYEEINCFDWIIFTSKNGVHHFFEQLNKIQGSTQLTQHLKFAVMGNATAKELESFSYFPEFINKGNTSKELLEYLQNEYNLSGKKILLALGNLAGDLLYDGLKHIANITRIDVYKTEKPDFVDLEKIKMIRKNAYDLIVFTSPSAFNNLIEIEPQINLNELKAACIGPVTADALIKRGVEPLVIAEKSSMDGLFSAIVAYFGKK